MPHSALGYRPPEEFEREANTGVDSAGATMSFFRHEEIYVSVWFEPSRRFKPESNQTLTTSQISS